MSLIKYNEKEVEEIVGYDVFYSVLGWIKDSRWRKKCKRSIKRARSHLLIQKNRMESIVRQSRSNIGQLLMYGLHDDALARVDQLHNDQCALSAYGQIDNYCDIVYINLRNISNHSKLSYEAIEAISSLIFAASRCGELSELNRIRTLFKKKFGNEFERINVELQPGNFVNSQMKCNLGNNSVTDDLKLQMTREIARECALRLQPDQDKEENNVPQSQQLSSKKVESLDGRSGDVRGVNGKYQMQATKVKDMVRRIGSKFSVWNSRNFVSFRCDSYGNGSSGRTSSEGSPTIQDKSIIYLDDVEHRSPKNEVFSGTKNEANGLDSHAKSLSSKSFVKGFAQRSDSLVQKDAVYGKNDGSLHEKEMNNHKMLIKKGISRCNSYSHEQRKETEENEDSKPRLSYVHPKLPDYDELVATFTEYKKEYTKTNPNNRTLHKWMQW